MERLTTFTRKARVFQIFFFPYVVLDQVRYAEFHQCNSGNPSWVHNTVTEESKQSYDLYPLYSYPHMNRSHWMEKGIA